MRKLVLILGITIFFLSCQKEKIEHAVYEGKDLSTQASINRDKDSKIAAITVETDGRWKLYAGYSTDSINFTRPIAEAEIGGTYPLKIDDTRRSYFQLITDEGKSILSDTHLPMTGGYNFRDLGGIRTTEGRYVKWGKIFRSDDMHNLTDADLAYLSSIPLISVVDFRTEKEIEDAPDKKPQSLKNHYIYNITPGKLSPDDITKATKEQLVEEMKLMNRLLVSDSACVAQYQKFFKLLQDEKEVPLMFHCTAGKDRTGMGAALILFALGVDESTIISNYLLSNEYLTGKYDKLIEEYPNMQPLFEVKPEYLEAGIEQIKKDHGSVENYLTNVLGVDIPKFKEMYLY
jgi:protein-tyrosine phosphatase